MLEEEQYHEPLAAPGYRSVEPRESTSYLGSSREIDTKLHSISQHLEEVQDHEGHSRCVFSICFSPDGSLALTGSADKTAKLWSYHTRQVIHTFHGHEQWVQGVAFANKKMMIATGSDDKYVRIWEHADDASSLADGWNMRAELGRKDDPLHAHTLGALSVAFDPYDDFVASGSADTHVHIWRVGDAECAHEMLGHQDWVSKVAYSPDGMMLASSSYDETIRLWRVSDGEEIMTLTGHDNFVSSVAWCPPDGDRIVTTSGDYTVRIWQVKLPDGSIATATETKPLRVLYGHSGWVLSCAYSPLADRIATASADKTVIIWDPVTYQAVDRIALDDWVEDCAYVPRKYLSDELVTVGHFIDAHAWDVSSDNATRKGALPRRNSPTITSLLWLANKLERIILGGPHALAADEVAFIESVWEERLNKDPTDGTASIADFLAIATTEKRLMKLLRRKVFDEVVFNHPYPRSVQTALQQHMNAGATRLSREELMVALEGMRNWQMDQWGDADEKVQRRDKAARIPNLTNLPNLPNLPKSRKSEDLDGEGSQGRGSVASGTSAAPGRSRRKDRRGSSRGGHESGSGKETTSEEDDIGGIGSYGAVQPQPQPQPQGSRRKTRSFGRRFPRSRGGGTSSGDETGPSSGVSSGVSSDEMASHDET